jgi:predicted ATPase
MHSKGYSAPETRASLDQAQLLIERAEALGEAIEDPLLLFSILYGFWLAKLLAFNGDALRELAAQFLAFAEKQGVSGPIMIGNRLMGSSLLLTGNIVSARAHFDQASTLCEASKHRPLVTRFGIDDGISIFSHRSWVLWLLGYPQAALADAHMALSRARESGHTPTLWLALALTATPHIFCGNYTAAATQCEELIRLAGEKNATQVNAAGMAIGGIVLAMTRRASEAVQTLLAAITIYRSTGACLYIPRYLSALVSAYGELNQFDEAWRCSDEAMTAIRTTGEKWFEAEANRVAGEIALKSHEPDMAKAQAYFERALAVARQQQAKSWELRAAMSVARLWRDQGKRHEARDLLAPVYGWFTEGFDTLDLKEAKALLDELAA